MPPDLLESNHFTQRYDSFLGHLTTSADTELPQDGTIEYRTMPLGMSQEMIWDPTITASMMPSLDIGSNVSVRLPNGNRINLSEFCYFSKDGRAIFNDPDLCKAYDRAIERHISIKKEPVNRLKKILETSQKTTS